MLGDAAVTYSTATNRRSVRAFLRQALREPLLHFLIGGAAIFAIAHFVPSERAAAQRRIVVDEQLQRRIVELNQAQSGLTPSPAQVERLIEEYIDDEVMYREAVRMGLDRDDEIVRRRLIQKVQFLQRDLAAAPKPGEDELRAYYTAHAEQFSAPPSVTFEQLYFSADRGGWAAAETRARHAHTMIERTAMSAAQLDDGFPFEIPSGELTRVDAVGLFGQTPIVDALFNIPAGQWSAPVRSAYGWHLIKTAHDRVSGLSPFAEVRTQVEADYREEQTRAAERRELEMLRARYDILRQDKRSPGS